MLWLILFMLRLEQLSNSQKDYKFYAYDNAVNACIILIMNFMHTIMQ